MIKVFQKLVDKDKGDCMQCAIASLFELSYEETPKFVESKTGYFDLLYGLIIKNGYKYKGMLHNVTPEPGEKIYENGHVKNLHKYKGIDGYFWASVYSPKYFDEEKPETKYYNTHAVIIDKNFNIVHDPNPENANVEKYPLADKMGFNGILYVTLIEKEIPSEQGS